jgi:hypothetical protein
MGVVLLHLSKFATRYGIKCLEEFPGEGLRIGGRASRMNSKVKISQIRRVSRVSVVLNLAQSQFVSSRPLPAPIYR